jgi:heme exporter protein D
VGTVIAMFDALNDVLRTRARQLRDAAKMQEQAATALIPPVTPSTS